MPEFLTFSKVAEGVDKMQQQQVSAVNSCSPEWLAKQLDNLGDKNSVLVMDCRSPNDFNTSHVTGAIHVALPTIMLRRLKNGTLPVASVINNEGKEKFNSLYKTGTLVLYDQDSSSSGASISTVMLKKLKEDGCKAKLLEGGFAAFQNRYPAHCVGLTETGSTEEESTILGLCNLRISGGGGGGGSGVVSGGGSGGSSGGSLLIPGIPALNPDGDEVPTPNTYNNDPNEFPVRVLSYLYLGNAQNAADLECLYKNDIKYILNVTPDVPNTFEHLGTFKYMQIPITDHWSQNLSVWFSKAIAFIDEARTKEHGVLVHCLAGISRSVTVTVAYLMHALQMDFEPAYQLVRECKPNISPNINFMVMLLDFQKSLGRCDDCRARAGSTSSDEFTCTCSPRFYLSSSSSVSTTPSSGEYGQPDSPYVPS